MLGVSPTLIRALIPKGEPQADTSSLRVITTTGEPWNPDPYLWLHEHVGRGRTPIVNISGGTEVGACFLSVCVAYPIKPISLGFPALGEDMDVFDPEGRSVRGEVGELVCKRPFPGMTRGLWGAPERYLETYWRRFPGVWTHGDWASVDEDGYWYLHGRSDDTLNIAGKRIGPAELESAAVSHPGIAEAAAVGVPHDVKGEVAWIFCVRTPDTDAAEQEVAAKVAEVLGKAFTPERIVFVGSLPKTRSAKIVRRAVRAKVLGKDPGDLSSLENPEVARGDRECHLSSPESRSSRAVAAESAQTSRVSSRARGCASRCRRAHARRSRRSRRRSTGSRSRPTSRSRRTSSGWSSRPSESSGRSSSSSRTRASHCGKSARGRCRSRTGGACRR